MGWTEGGGHTWPGAGLAGGAWPIDCGGVLPGAPSGNRADTREGACGVEARLCLVDTGHEYSHGTCRFGTGTGGGGGGLEKARE
jgi:hypothetical protein